MMAAGLRHEIRVSYARWWGQELPWCINCRTLESHQVDYQLFQSLEFIVYTVEMQYCQTQTQTGLVKFHTGCSLCWCMDTSLCLDSVWTQVTHYQTWTWHDTHQTRTRVESWNVELLQPCWNVAETNPNLGFPVCKTQASGLKKWVPKNPGCWPK